MSLLLSQLCYAGRWPVTLPTYERHLNAGGSLKIIVKRNKDDLSPGDLGGHDCFQIG